MLQDPFDDTGHLDERDDAQGGLFDAISGGALDGSHTPGALRYYREVGIQVPSSLL